MRREYAWVWLVLHCEMTENGGQWSPPWIFTYISDSGLPSYESWDSHVLVIFLRAVTNARHQQLRGGRIHFGSRSQKCQSITAENKHTTEQSKSYHGGQEAEIRPTRRGRARLEMPYSSQSPIASSCYKSILNGMCSLSQSPQELVTF